MSKIEWTVQTWNPIAGCSIVSPGCANCYAMRMAARINKMMPSSHYDGLTKIVNGNPVWTGQLSRAPDKIFNAPLKWGKPTRIFVNSMSDLFHDDMLDEWIDRVFGIIGKTPQHIYQVLTKRPSRMRRYFWSRFGERPPSNVWLGVSVEDQARADERIPLLLDTPAAVRFISAEPLLGPVDLKRLRFDSDPEWRLCALTGDKWDQLMRWHDIRGATANLDWAILGGESGPGKRPVDLAWMRSIRDQCQAAGVPLFVKQIDKRIPIPDDLKIRQWPKGLHD